MAQTQLYGSRAQLHLTEEGTTGTYAPPAGTGAEMLMIMDGWSYTVESSNYEPTYTRPDWLVQDEVPGAVSVTITFSLPLKGSGDAGDVAPELDLVLKACGWDVTPSAGVSHTYAPVSTFTGTNLPGPSYSCTIVVDGEAYPLKNGFGTFTITGTVGEPAMLECTMTGGYVAPLADGLEAVSGYSTVVPPAFMGGALTIGAATPTGVTSFTLDSGNNVTTITDVNDANGISGARITGRRITGSIDAEVLASRDDFALWRAGTVGAFTTGAIGVTDNQYTIACARIVRRPIEFSVADGIAKHTIPFVCASAATDVEGTTEPVTITFT